MSNELILFITLIIYVLGMVFSLNYDRRTVIFVSILWLVPIFLVENTFITLFSVIMFLLHIIIPVLNETGGKDDFL